MSNHEEPGDLSAAEGIAVLLALTGSTIIVFGGLLWLCVAGVMPAWAALVAGIALGVVIGAARR